MADHSVFVLEKLKHKALIELETRVEKYVKEQFYSKILPKVINDIKNKLIIDLVNDDEMLSIEMRINRGDDNAVMGDENNKSKK